MSEKTWKFNVDHTWENFSYLIEDQFRFYEAENTFLANKYNRSCLYHGEVAIESLLNRLMREKLQQEGKKEKKIFGQLKQPGFYTKLTEWPNDIFNKNIQITNEQLNLFEIFEKYYRLRNNLTHPKHFDHSIYDKLNKIDPQEIVVTVSRVLVELFLLRDKIFPYWLLGWNFVGFNGDDNHPVLLGNAQFLHALDRMGFIKSETAWSYDKSNNWQSKNMSSFKGLKLLRKRLDKYSYKREKAENFEGPILTKNWWQY